MKKKCGKKYKDHGKVVVSGYIANNGNIGNIDAFRSNCREFVQRV